MESSSSPSSSSSSSSNRNNTSKRRTMLSVVIVCGVVLSIVLLAFNSDLASKPTNYVRRKLQESTAGLIPPKLPEILNSEIPPRDPLMMGRAGGWTSSSDSIPVATHHSISEEDTLIPTTVKVSSTTTTKPNQNIVRTDIPIVRDEMSPSPAPKMKTKKPTVSPIVALTVSPAHSHMPIEQLPPSGLMKPSGPNQPDANLPDVPDTHPIPSTTITTSSSSSSSSSSSKKTHQVNEEIKIDRQEKFIPLAERSSSSSSSSSTGDINRRTSIEDQLRVDETSPYWSFIQRAHDLHPSDEPSVPPVDTPFSGLMTSSKYSADSSDISATPTVKSLQTDAGIMKASTTSSSSSSSSSQIAAPKTIIQNGATLPFRPVDEAINTKTETAHPRPGDVPIPLDGLTKDGQPLPPTSNGIRGSGYGTIGVNPVAANDVQANPEDNREVKSFGLHPTKSPSTETQSYAPNTPTRPGPNPSTPTHVTHSWTPTMATPIAAPVSTPIATPVAAPVTAPTLISAKPVEADVPVVFGAAYHSSSSASSATSSMKSSSKTTPLTAVEKARFGEVPAALLPPQQRQMTNTGKVSSKASFTSASSTSSSASSDYLNNMGITFTAASPILPSVDLEHNGLMKSNGKDLLEDVSPTKLAEIAATSTSLKKAAKTSGSLKQSSTSSSSDASIVTLKKATKDKTVTTTKTVPFKPEDEAVSTGITPHPRPEDEPAPLNGLTKDGLPLPSSSTGVRGSARGFWDIAPAMTPHSPMSPTIRDTSQAPYGFPVAAPVQVPTPATPTVVVPVSRTTKPVEMVDMVSTNKPQENTPEPPAPVVVPPTPVVPPDAPVDGPPVQGPPHSDPTTTTTTTTKLDKANDEKVEETEEKVAEVVSTPDVTISTPQEIISSSPAIQAALDAALAEALATAGGNVKKSSKNQTPITTTTTTTTKGKTASVFDPKLSDSSITTKTSSVKVKKSQHD